MNATGADPINLPGSLVGSDKNRDTFAASDYVGPGPEIAGLIILCFRLGNVKLRPYCSFEHDLTTAYAGSVNTGLDKATECVEKVRI